MSSHSVQSTMVQTSRTLAEGYRLLYKIRISNFEVLFRIVGFLDFVHHPEFEILENTTFWKLDLFSSQVRGGRYLLCWVLSKE
jgi:hypothetical protein